MKLDIIFLVVLGICAVLFFSSSTCSNTEHFDAASDIKAAVNTIYQADVGAIRTLADISSKLTNGQFLTVPGALSINGVTNVNSGVINLTNGWRIDTTDGHFRVWHTPSGAGQDLKFTVHQGTSPAYINYGIDVKDWVGTGNGTINCATLNSGTINNTTLNSGTINNTTLNSRSINTSDTLTVNGALNANSYVNTPSIRRIGGDWLRINDGGNGKIAMYGQVNVGENGLAIGDWNENAPGRGNLRLSDGSNTWRIQPGWSNELHFRNSASNSFYAIYKMGQDQGKGI
jgi:hypothetical protein